MSIFDIFKPFQRKVHMFFKRRMLPMSVDEAMEKKEFFAKLYLLTSFSIFSFLMYKILQEKQLSRDPNVPLAEATIENLKLDGKIRIMRFHGLSKIEDYYYKRKEEEEEENNTKPELNQDAELLVETISEVKSEVL